MPGASGLDVMSESMQADSTSPVIHLTAFGSVEEAVAAMKEGAFDFIQKPVDLDHLKLLVERATRQQVLLRANLILRGEFSARYGFPRIVCESPDMKTVSHQLQRVAPTHSTVLRIVVATNRDLAERIREKLFREDLYFRIAAVPLTIPPLRDRDDDLLLLAAHFLEKFGREFGKGPLTLNEDARRRLRAYAWPGNVRELQNALERAA